MAQKIHRYVAGSGGSSQKVETVVVDKRTREERVLERGEQKTSVLRGAEFMLARLNLTRPRYEKWSQTKRIVRGYTLWLLALPVLPFVLMAFLRARHPDTVTREPLFWTLLVLGILWVVGVFGLLNLV